MPGSHRAGLLLVGWLLGVGTPFFLIGSALFLTGHSMKIEVVPDAGK